MPVSTPAAVVGSESYAARIQALRQRCFERKLQPKSDLVVASARALQASADVASWQVRKGLVVRERLRSIHFDLDEHELLVGRLAPATADEAAPSAAARAYVGTFPGPGGQTGHCELERERIFALGIDGMLAELTAQGATASGDGADALASFAEALLGFSEMIEQAAVMVESRLDDAPPRRRRELEQLALSCRRLAHQPPQSFRDALQLTWFMDLGVMLGEQVYLVVSGHLDRVLLPYYERDLAAGSLDDAEALALIECLYILINEFIPDGLAMSAMVGGRDAHGRDVTNPLSALCLEALRRTRLVYPTVGICWHEGTPAALTELGAELIAAGLCNVAFFGDETIQRGLTRLGVQATEACNYINSTCVEITPVAASNVWVASPYFSTPGLLLEEVAAQAAAPAPAASFAAFLDAYRARLGACIDAAAAEQNRQRESRRLYGRKPLQSVFTRDCTARQRDIDDGGAVYNWVECSFVGLANLADSLEVIRAEVYDSGRLSLRRLRDLLGADFAGQEAERQRFLAYPKYGNGEVQVDSLLADIIQFAAGECARQRLLPDDAHFVPGAFCWIMHERLGHECGATPDGRKAGFPFADGCGPAQGREHCGPTTAILSTTSWDHSPLIGGAAYNMKFTRALFADSGARGRLRDLIVTFLRRGGFETQVNVVDAALLRSARQTPEAYRDLVVRIGGYTDYFVRLSPQMQDEVILRTEFQEF
jgi:formate C-acetyltransferase